MITELRLDRRSIYLRNQLIAVILLGALSALVFWLIFPADWSYVRTRSQPELHDPVHWWQDLLYLAVLSVLGIVAGLCAYWWIGAIGVTVPTVILYCVQASAARAPEMVYWALAVPVLVVGLPLWMVWMGRIGVQCRRHWRMGAWRRAESAIAPR